MVRSLRRDGRKPFGTGTSRERHDHARRPSSNTAIAGVACDAEPGVVGFFHIAIAERQTAEGKLHLFVGIDRTSKFAVAQLVGKADRRTAWEFLEHLLQAVPYRIHTILTDNGIQFVEQPRNRDTAWSRQMRFDIICEANDIEHRLTKPNHLGPTARLSA